MLEAPPLIHYFCPKLCLLAMKDTDVEKSSTVTEFYFWTVVYVLEWDISFIRPEHNFIQKTTKRGGSRFLVIDLALFVIIS